MCCLFYFLLHSTFFEEKVKIQLIIYVHCSDTLWLTPASKESACRIICTRGTPENGGMVRAFPLCPFKRVATGAEVPFHHRCTCRQIFGVGRILPEFSQSFLTDFWATFAYQFSPTKIMTTSFWCNLQIRSIMIIKYDPKPVTSFSVNIGTNQIAQTNCTKYLVVILDDKLSWYQHINNREDKLALTLGIFAWQDTIWLLLHWSVYFCLFYSHRQYAIGAWGSFFFNLFEPWILPPTGHM